MSERYVIGTYNRGVDGGVPIDGGMPGTLNCSAANSCRFAADLDHSGVSNLGDVLQLASASVKATLRYRGESARIDGWAGDPGPTLTRGLGEPQPALPTPFTDATGAVGLSVIDTSYAAGPSESGAVGADDFVVEVVLRAAVDAPVFARTGAAFGWSANINSAGALGLDLSDGTRTVRVSSEALTARAWYHCLFWISRAAGGRADCNGRAGALADLSGLGTLGPTGSFAVGGAGGADAVQLALFQVFRVAPGTLGPEADWQTMTRRRFAAVTGVFPSFADGSALPAPDLRNSVALLDMQHLAGGPRRLFLVGPDWARIVCRTDAAGARDCGYLAEPERNRVVDPSPSASTWMASEVTVTVGDVLFVDGEQRMDTLIPSAAAARHAVIRRGTFSPNRQALSFFAHAGAGRLLGASVGSLGTAVYDVTSGQVVSMPANVAASIEDWGNGIFRCAYSVVPGGGALDYRVMLLNDAGAEMFAGDGMTIGAHIWGMQLDLEQGYPRSLLPANAQAAERLTFVGNDGNLPKGGVVSLQLRVLMPPGRRQNDQAIININKGGSFDDQIQMFVVATAGTFRFWGLAATMNRWTCDHPATAVDGLRHSLAAEWGGPAARFWVDGVSVNRNTSNLTPALFTMDRIDVAFSLHSSTYLQGLVAGLQVTGS
ncbi:MAG TPA: hypothetical protein VFH73_21635 [Polyangia bacterium]|nr:hypothetical protein [Polyangia bacterium]